MSNGGRVLVVMLLPLGVAAAAAALGRRRGKRAAQMDLEDERARYPEGEREFNEAEGAR